MLVHRSQLTMSSLKNKWPPLLKPLWHSLTFQVLQILRNWTCSWNPWWATVKIELLELEGTVGEEQEYATFVERKATGLMWCNTLKQTTWQGCQFHVICVETFSAQGMHSEYTKVELTDMERIQLRKETMNWWIKAPPIFYKNISTNCQIYLLVHFPVFNVLSFSIKPKTWFSLT